ncbi:MAG: MucR family transcriptional regulator [Pseudomonadota bacterium]
MAEQETLQQISAEETLRLTTDIVAAYLSNNTLNSEQIPEVIRNVHAALGDVGGASLADQPTNQKPAVPIKKSVTADYIICLEDGKKLKMLKRYLRSQYNMSPEDYRKKWGLPADYPMVAPNYAKRRSEFAKQIGLGRQARKTTKSRKRARK